MPFLRGLFAMAVAGLTAFIAIPTASAEPVEPDYPVVMAVGDIACDPNSPGFNKGVGTTAGCRQQAVGDMITAQNPDAFLALGDIQYHDGRMDALMASYDKALGSLKDRTYPVPGDHDFLTANGTDYYKYFGDNANQQDKGTYAYRMGDWLVLAINTINCSPYYPCGPGSTTQRFIAGALAANPAKCVMAYWHHPIWSAGEHGNFAPGVPVWNQLHEAGVDVVLTGNNHLYQRFRPLGKAQADGMQVMPPSLDPEGMVEFVVGTGGQDNHQATRLDRPEFISTVAASGTDVVNGVFGALKMTLKPDSYDFSFVPAAGSTYTDSGSRGCRTKTPPTGTPPQIDQITTTRSGDGAITVSWPEQQVPADTPPVTYKVQVAGTSRNCSTTSNSCRVTGLTNGSQYRFRVQASNTNAFTNGAFSPAITAAKPPSRPSAPTVIPRPSGALLNWEAPSDNGGMPVTSYTATASPGGATCTSTTRSCFIGDLKVGAKYTFTVKATTEAGTSASSSASTSVVIPATAPPAPPSITALRRAGDGSAGVTTAASTLPGSVTTTIKVTAAPGGRTCTVTLPAQECIVTGLANGSTYTFTAKATGPDGTSVSSGVSDPLLVGRRPGRPQNAIATPLAGGDARVTWDVPTWDGGLPVTSYRVTGASGTGCTTDGKTQCLVTGLKPGTKYTWSVYAVNAAGTSEASIGTPPVVALAPSAPDAPTITAAERAGDGKARVVVNAGRANGSEITSFTVKVSPGLKSCTFSPPATECTVSGLTNGSFYTFSATATNALGTSPASPSTAPLQVGKVPGRPTELAVTAQPGGLALVTWKPPAYDGGLPVTGYAANTTVGKLSCKTSGELQCMLQGLEVGKTYTVVASATNAAGTSVSSLTGPTVTGLAAQPAVSGTGTGFAQ